MTLLKGLFCDVVSTFVETLLPAFNMTMYYLPVKVVLPPLEALVQGALHRLVTGVTVLQQTFYKRPNM
jgi:hypothetical protein